jgi:hypothetical protein
MDGINGEPIGSHNVRPKTQMSKFWVIYISNFYRPHSDAQGLKDRRPAEKSGRRETPGFFILFFIDILDSVC